MCDVKFLVYSKVGHLAFWQTCLFVRMTFFFVNSHFFPLNAFKNEGILRETRIEERQKSLKKLNIFIKQRNSAFLKVFQLEQYEK